MCEKCDRAEEREPFLVRAGGYCIVFLIGLAVGHGAFVYGGY